MRPEEEIERYLNTINMDDEVEEEEIEEELNWKAEKWRYLSMDIFQKRELLGYTVEFKKIRTWKSYANRKPLAPKIERLEENTIDETKNEVLAKKISLYRGDITKLEVDVIVNATNSSLLAGGDLDGAIHDAAGPYLRAECKSLRWCLPGEAILTGGYALPATFVIQTVGPQGKRPIDLQNCYTNSLNILLERKLKTIAFPCISTGIYAYPNEAAAHVAIYRVRKHLEINAGSVHRIIFCVFLDTDKAIYEGLLQSYFPLENAVEPDPEAIPLEDTSEAIPLENTTEAVVLA